jgi:hypothetical protein
MLIVVVEFDSVDIGYECFVVITTYTYARTETDWGSIAWCFE